MVTMRETLCWECKKATGGCSWADSLEPVEGWEATPTEVYGETYTSYCVTSCPQFKLDDKRTITVKEIAEILNMNIRVLFRRLKAKPELIKEQLKNKGYELMVIINKERHFYCVRKVI